MFIWFGALANLILGIVYILLYEVCTVLKPGGDCPDAGLSYL